MGVSTLVTVVPFICDLPDRYNLLKLNAKCIKSTADNLRRETTPLMWPLLSGRMGVCIKGDHCDCIVLYCLYMYIVPKIDLVLIVHNVLLSACFES